MTSSPSQSSRILKQYFSRKQEQNPAYSLRALSRDLDVAPSYVSGLLNGKKRPSLEMIGRLAPLLDFDESAEAALRMATTLEAISDPQISKELRSNSPMQTLNAIPLFKPLSRRKLSLLERWYHVAILDLMECDDFEDDPQWIAKRLGLFPHDVQDSIRVLQKLGLVERTERKGKVVWTKRESRIRLPTARSIEEIRQFHRQMIERALLELRFKTAQKDFERRLISGITLAVDPRNIARARRKLEAAIHEISAELMTGKCTEVYQLNVQLFPLTKSR